MWFPMKLAGWVMLAWLLWRMATALSPPSTVTAYDLLEDGCGYEGTRQVAEAHPWCFDVLWAGVGQVARQRSGATAGEGAAAAGRGQYGVALAHLRNAGAHVESCTGELRRMTNEELLATYAVWVARKPHLSRNLDAQLFIWKEIHARYPCAD